MKTTQKIADLPKKVAKVARQRASEFAAVLVHLADYFETFEPDLDAESWLRRDPFFLCHIIEQADDDYEDDGNTRTTATTYRLVWALPLHDYGVDEDGRYLCSSHWRGHPHETIVYSLDIKLRDHDGRVSSVNEDFRVYPYGDGREAMARSRFASGYCHARNVELDEIRPMDLTEGEYVEAALLIREVVDRVTLRRRFAGMLTPKPARAR